MTVPMDMLYFTGSEGPASSRAPSSSYKWVPRAPTFRSHHREGRWGGPQARTSLADDEPVQGGLSAYIIHRRSLMSFKSALTFGGPCSSFLVALALPALALAGPARVA